MRKTISALLIIFISACSDNKAPANSPDQAVIQRDSSEAVSNRSTADSSTVPSRQFLHLAQQIDSAGYSWDTARIRNLNYYYRTDSIVASDSYVFYRMQVNDSRIMEFYTLNKDRLRGDSPLRKGLVEPSHFKKASSLFGYFYRQKDEASLLVDGYIEEWLFPTSEDAENATKEVDRVKEMVYFNTTAFCCRIGKRIYIFHTRASAFSGPLGLFFQRFVKNTHAL